MTVSSEQKAVGSEKSKPMIRKILVCLLVTALLPPVYFAEAQQSKIPKIGWLSARPASSYGLEGLRRELRTLGYVEAQNIAIESRYADNKLDRLPGLANELVRLRVDVLLTPAIPATVAAKNATKTIPIVFYTGSDPVALGLVDSLARPGGNITGFSTISSVVVSKRLELLKESVPKLARVAVLWSRQGSALQWKESQGEAQKLGLQLHSMEVSSADRYESAFEEAVKAGSSALVVGGSALDNANQKTIVNLAAKHRLPAICPRADYIAHGGLMSYGADRDEPYRRAASMIDKILKGTKPADIPVEQPRKFELVINLKTAKQIGLTIPPNVLARADRVIR